ncbi:hypothetical protein [Haloplanus salilacus]|uniref:hypothetical protein n=1 Tax=Haloplanus salilacus TaxID=2949994 RepID=UPI0030D05A24
MTHGSRRPGPTRGDTPDGGGRRSRGRRHVRRRRLRGVLRALGRLAAIADDLHDDLAAFQFVGGDVSGPFVSIDADADVSLASFAETCKSQVT